jgi:MFS family permease
MASAIRVGRPWTIVALLSLFMLINFLDKIVLGLVAVPMMGELQLTPQAFGSIGSSFFWFFALSGIVGGFLANRIRSKFLILVMVLIWSLSQLPLWSATSIGTIVVSRALLGLGEGPAWPVAIHALCKWFPNDRRNVPIAVMAQGSSVGLILAGLLIPWITANWGWRANFLVLAVIGCALGLVWFFFGEEGAIESELMDATPGGSVGTYLRLLCDRSVLGSIVTHFAGYWSLALALTWLPAYFQLGLGYDGITAGWIYSFAIVLTIPFGLTLAWGSERLLENGVSSKFARGRYLSSLLLVAGVLFATVYLSPPGNVLRIGLIAVALGCTPIVYSVGPAILAEVVPAPQRGAMLAVNNSVASLAGIVAPIVAGALIRNIPGAAGYETSFALCGGLMVLGGLAGFLLIDPEKSKRAAGTLAASAL